MAQTSEPTPPTEIEALKRHVDGLEDLLHRQFSAAATDDPKLNLRFITIRRTTDIAAFVALLLSTLAMLLQLQSFYAGPDIKSFPPRRIVIYNSDLFKDNSEYLFGNNSQVLFAAITSYSNKAAKDHPALVLDEFIRIKVGNATKRQHWFYATGSSLFRGPFQYATATPSRPIPFPVNGNSGFAHEVLFQPMTSPYCLAGDPDCAGAHTWYGWNEFIKDLQTSSPRTIAVTLGAERDNQTPLMVNCKIAELSDDQLNILGSEGLLAAECGAS